MRVISTFEHDRRMRTLWPEFLLKERTKWSARWVGGLRPIVKVHTVEIVLHRPRPQRPRPPGPNPRVRVLSGLRRRADEAIPHIYRNAEDPDDPYLCLFFGSGEWHSGRAIADTIVPWAAEWLACYEGWRATGVWYGGGVAH